MRYLVVLVLCLVLMSTVRAQTQTILATTTGNALETPDFYRVAFLAGDPEAWIASVTFTLPSGFFDFDGETSYLNATAPVLYPPSLSGLVPGDITFYFDGVHPTSLTVRFTSGAFRVGDTLGFAADVDDLGSKLGGVFGAGATFSATLGSGAFGSAPFRTNTSVASSATVTIEDSFAIPETGTLALLALGMVPVALRRRKTALV